LILHQGRAQQPFEHRIAGGNFQLRPDVFFLIQTREIRIQRAGAVFTPDEDFGGGAINFLGRERGDGHRNHRQDKKERYELAAPEDRLQSIAQA